MNIERLKADLKRDEGIVYKIYLDPLGYKTLGVGHLVKPLDFEAQLPVGTSVSPATVDFYFEQDIALSQEDCYKLYKNFQCYPGEVKEVLVNMAFNLGRTRLAKFVNFKIALDAHDFKRAAVEGRDSLWYRQVTSRAERLMTRLENIS